MTIIVMFQLCQKIKNVNEFNFFKSKYFKGQHFKIVLSIMEADGQKAKNIAFILWFWI